jgi:hypothetical protein
MARIKITKLQAVKEQLETAIDLFFNDGSPVSIHTLTWAAYNVLCDLNKHKGGSPTLINDGFLSIVKPEHKKALRRKLREAHTFFKHADKDPDDELEFEPAQTDYVLVDACDRYHLLHGSVNHRISAFQVWFFLSRRYYLNAEYNAEIDRMTFEKKDKAKFYKEYMALPPQEMRYVETPKKKK